MTPIRVQLSRRSGWRMPENTVKVDRSSTVFGNPFMVGEPVPKVYLHMELSFEDTARYLEGDVVPDAAEAVRLYTKYALPHKSDLALLRGRNLACWCKVGDPCHADVLLELANR